MTIDDELVTVIIPVYNVKKYLSRCVESVVSQSYANLQIILVDDGSTDGSGQLCDSFRNRDSRIEVIHTENGGLSAARNAGMDLVRGSRVIFVDSDDMIGCNHVANLFSALKFCSDSSRAVSVTGLTPVVDGAEVSDENVFINGAFMLSPAQAISESVTLEGRFAAHACGKMFPSYMIDKFRFPVGKFYEDQFVIYKFFLEASEVVYEESNDYFYTTGRAGSISLGSRINELDYLDALRITMNDVAVRCPEALDAVNTRYLSSLIYGVETACLTNRKDILGPIFQEAMIHRDEALCNSSLSSTAKIKYRALVIGPKLFSFVVVSRNSLKSNSSVLRDRIRKAGRK